jgi:hypothetical protein
MGMAGHMSLRELHRLLAEPETVNVVLLSVDPRDEHAVQARVDELPMVASAGNVKRLIQKFAEQSGKSMDVFATWSSRSSPGPSPSGWSTTTRASR